MSPSPHVRIARVYAPPTPADGARVLVDRLWPRGLAKAAAQLDDWCKAIAPSTELRGWYGHVPERFEEFVGRYRAELEEPARVEALTALTALSRRGPVTLLTATKVPELSHAAVIAQAMADSD
jgi:uncharacterized protein YeaO (DUF488 family)